MSVTTISLPTNINGITEFGIAASTDELADPKSKLFIYWKATASAPRKPDDAEVRCINLVKEWNSLESLGGTNAVDARMALFANDAAIVGSSRASKDAIISHIDNWPEDSEKAGTTRVLLAGNLALKIEEYDTWMTIEASRRDHVEVDVEKTIAAADPPLSNPTAMSVFYGMLHLALVKGWIIRDGIATMGQVVHCGPEVTAAGMKTAAEINAIGFNKAQVCGNLIIAAKITWFMTNHHVGQRDGHLESYVRKVASAADLISDSDSTLETDVRKAVWIVSKAVSTRGVLSAIGITGVVYGDNSNTGRREGNDYAIGGILTINITSDAALRASSNPAGTAEHSTYLAIAKKAAGSMFSICIPPLTSLGYNVESASFTGRVIANEAAMLANPAGHHMGARFLTGADRITLESWTEEEMQNLAAFIHATQPNGTLAKANVVIPKEQVSDTIVYASIMSAKASIVRGTGSMANQMLIARLAGGDGSGGMAFQFGAITAEQVNEVRNAVTALESGEVSADEEAEGTETAARRRAREARNADRKARRENRARARLLMPASASGDMSTIR